MGRNATLVPYPFSSSPPSCVRLACRYLSVLFCQSRGFAATKHRSGEQVADTRVSSVVEVRSFPPLMRSYILYDFDCNFRLEWFLIVGPHGCVKFVVNDQRLDFERENFKIYQGFPPFKIGSKVLFQNTLFSIVTLTERVKKSPRSIVS